MIEPVLIWEGRVEGWVWIQGMVDSAGAVSILQGGRSGTGGAIGCGGNNKSPSVSCRVRVLAEACAYQ